MEDIFKYILELPSKVINVLAAINVIVSFIKNARLFFRWIRDVLKKPINISKEYKALVKLIFYLLQRLFKKNPLAQYA